MRLRRLIECVLAALGGLCALAIPVWAGDAVRGYEAAFLPVMRDIVEGVNGTSVAALLGVGVAAGRFAKSPPFVLGFSSAAILPIWSLFDLALGGQGHNLLPFEWLIYGVYGLVGTAGAIIGRNRGLRVRPEGARSAG